MAKRFIDTDIWKKDFVRGLKAPCKLLWLYVITDCNHAGIWDCDFEVAQIRTGEKLDKEKAEHAFSEKIVILEGGKKWFIPSFIAFQYGELNPSNRAHIGVISLLKKYDLISDDLIIKPLASPFQGAKDKDKDKEQDKDKDKDKEERQKSKIEDRLELYTTCMFGSGILETWETWITYKRKEHGEKYKCLETEKVAINHLFKLTDGDLSYANEIVMYSIAMRYKGLYPPKSNTSTQKPQNTTKHGGNMSIAQNLLLQLTDEPSEQAGHKKRIG